MERQEPRGGKVDGIEEVAEMQGILSHSACILFCSMYFFEVLPMRVAACIHSIVKTSVGTQYLT